jgi:hypothetical protein
MRQAPSKFKQYKRLGNWINTPKPKRSARVLKKKKKGVKNPQSMIKI